MSPVSRNQLVKTNENKPIIPNHAGCGVFPIWDGPVLSSVPYAWDPTD
jgi:hypothetical protein